MTRRFSTARLLGLSATMALMMGVSANLASAAPVAPANIAVPAAATDVRGDLVQQVQFGNRGLRGGRGIGGNRGLRAGRGVRVGRGFRGNRWAGRGRGRGLGWIGPAIIGSAIVGGTLASRGSYGSSYGDAGQRCDDAYRSFRWSDGTYQPYGDGPRELCPYLR